MSPSLFLRPTWEGGHRTGVAGLLTYLKNHKPMARECSSNSRLGTKTLINAFNLPIGEEGQLELYLGHLSHHILAR